jgi:ATPase subunit of ABC transporter with duplicated ATPase domains
MALSIAVGLPPEHGLYTAIVAGLRDIIMSHQPILGYKLSLEFFYKTCFADFNVSINYGDQIAIIGRNGSGKSSLLNILRQALAPTSGEVKIPHAAVIAYIPQVIEAFDDLSGGQRFNQALTAALGQNPDILLLDEPTNHLDLKTVNHYCGC